MLADACHISSLGYLCLNTKIRLTMLCLSGFELYSPCVPLKCTNICVDLV